MKSDYNGSLTREKILFYEIRIVASLYLQGYSKQDIIQKITADNMFQFPTVRMISSIAGTCLRRIEALNSETLVYHLANALAEVVKPKGAFHVLYTSSFRHPGHAVFRGVGS